MFQNVTYVSNLQEMHTDYGYLTCTKPYILRKKDTVTFQELRNSQTLHPVKVDQK